ncbi:hypothetical protein DRO66_02455 [Candidatus Bathyarchaeota archaeon]|nr:MAG: hypothetical protein DRO66_02455 [Candidatus Bathyarchaeota archaeon]
MGLEYPRVKLTNLQQVHQKLCELLEKHAKDLDLLSDVHSVRLLLSENTPLQTSQGRTITMRLKKLQEAEFVIKERLKGLYIHIETVRSFYSALRKGDRPHTENSNMGYDGLDEEIKEPIVCSPPYPESPLPTPPEKLSGSSFKL